MINKIYGKIIRINTDSEGSGFIDKKWNSRLLPLSKHLR